MATAVRTCKNAVRGPAMVVWYVTSAVDNGPSKLTLVHHDSNNIVSPIKGVPVRSTTMLTQPHTCLMALMTLNRRTTNTVDMFVQIPMSMAIVPEIAVFGGRFIKLLTAIAGAALLEPQIKVSTMQAEN